jgi:hypothetical protein
MWSTDDAMARRPVLRGGAGLVTAGITMTVLPSAAMAASPSGGGDGSDPAVLNVTYFEGGCSENTSFPEESAFTVFAVFSDAEVAKYPDGDFRFLIGTSAAQESDWRMASGPPGEYDTGLKFISVDVPIPNLTCDESQFATIDDGTQPCRFGAFEDGVLVAISPVLEGFIPEPR